MADANITKTDELVLQELMKVDDQERAETSGRNDSVEQLGTTHLRARVTPSSCDLMHATLGDGCMHVASRR
jgi:hypothetical protein